MTACLPATDDRTPAPRAEDEVYDVLTVLTLLLGGFLVPVVGWLAGVVLLWASPRWTAAQKWLGTVIWPAIVAVPAAVGLALAATTGQAAAGVVGAAVTGVIALFVALPLVFVRLLRHRRAA